MEGEEGRFHEFYDISSLQAVMNQHQEANAEAQRGIYHSKEYHDIELKCKDNILFAHSAILLPRSAVLANREDTRWSVTETNLRQFDMSDQHSFIVNAALSYIYTSEYNDDPAGTYSNLNMLPRILPLPHQPQHSFPPAKNLDDSRLVFNTELYIFSRKYKIEMLECLAAEKFYDVARLPSPPLFNSNTDVLERRPAFVAAGSLLCDNMPDFVDRKSDELWRTMKVISFTNYMILKDARWKDGEEKRIFWEREDFMTELLETGWHLYRDLSMRLRNPG
ncbi:hypothetical protein BCON_0007g00870 [Botryotinia convoluta]|uniref:Uncharacterized protein n=1 Tax=Botryotinia convoluta TaxID=54673 RepID=A0A4Z1J6E4_9HELO|nr:hypothetical protein BCON_0007g00870 [Botryotinia convoluta]